MQGTLTFVEDTFVHLESLLHFLTKSRLHFWTPALFALMKLIFVLVEAGLIDNSSRFITELVEVTFAVLDDMFTLVETSLIYTCRGFVCACGALINTCSSPICTCGSLICTCDF